jgi:beta-glucosidase
MARVILYSKPNLLYKDKPHSSTNFYKYRSTDDFWHGPADDEQFYERGRTIYQGIQSVSPEGATVDYMRGFYINGTDINMDDVLNVAPEYDAIVACIGEHMYAECN